jgi:hypothetical protein
MFGGPTSSVINFHKQIDGILLTATGGVVPAIANDIYSIIIIESEHPVIDELI